MLKVVKMEQDKVEGRKKKEKSSSNEQEEKETEGEEQQEEASRDRWSVAETQAFTGQGVFATTTKNIGVKPEKNITGIPQGLEHLLDHC
jgi:hypothetical protein